MRMRSLPWPFSLHLGYDMHSTTHRRPRSSKAKAMGWTTSGSPATRVTLKPSGRVIALGASFGGMGRSSGAATSGRGRRRRTAKQRDGMAKPLAGDGDVFDLFDRWRACQVLSENGLITTRAETTSHSVT